MLLLSCADMYRLPALPHRLQLEKYEVVPSHIQEKIVANAKVAA